MPISLDLPHVLHAFLDRDEIPRRVLWVVSDGNAEERYDLAKALEKLLDPRKGYDEIRLRSIN